MTSYIPDGELIPDTNHANIAKRYIAGEFWFDFVAWLPIFAVVDNSPDSFWRLFFTLKVIRVSKGVQMLNVMALMENIKSWSNARIASIIENDEELAENTNEDNNNISALIHINLSLKICKLALVILVVSYFVGITFFIYSDMVHAICGLVDA